MYTRFTGTANAWAISRSCWVARMYSPRRVRPSAIHVAATSAAAAAATISLYPE